MQGNDRIFRLFQENRLTELSPDDWHTALKSILREDMEDRASYGGEPVPTWAESLPRINISQFAFMGSHDSTPLLDTLEKIRALPAKTRPIFAGGVDLLVQECLQRIREPGAEELLEDVLALEYFFEGLVSGHLAEEIILNRGLEAETRRPLVATLDCRSFSTSVSEDCWKAIYEEVPQEPIFAPSVMGHLVKIGNVEDALRVPLIFTPAEDDTLAFLDVQEVLRDVIVMGRASKETLALIFDQYPQWARELVDEFEISLR